jgi:hypothetical protein
MTDWLDLMLGEIKRRQQEQAAALEELERRRQDPTNSEADASVGVADERAQEK